MWRMVVFFATIVAKAKILLDIADLEACTAKEQRMEVLEKERMRVVQQGLALQAFFC
jgi:hypothetical protein